MSQAYPDIVISIPSPSTQDPEEEIMHDSPPSGSKIKLNNLSPFQSTPDKATLENRAAYLQSFRNRLAFQKYTSEESLLSHSDKSPVQLLKNPEAKKSKFGRPGVEEKEIILQNIDLSPCKTGSNPEINDAVQEVQCPVCFCDYEADKLSKPLSCQHEFCMDCLHTYILRQIDEFRVLKIKCPQDQCEILFVDDDIQKILTEDEFNAYKNKKLLKLRNQDPNLKYCPKPGCTKPFYPDLARKSTKCSCGTVICHGCFNPQHEGKSCSEINAGEYELYMQDTNIKKCFVCKTIVDKNEGCAHISCPVCDYEWCWDCGREWEPGHGNSCTNRWSPQPPRALKENEQKNFIDKGINGIFLMFEILFFWLSTAIGVVFIWPCEMSLEIAKYLKTKMKNMKAVRVLSIFSAILSWIPAIVIYPFFVIIEEYGVCFRRKKRWLKGTSTRFGFRRLSRNLGRPNEPAVAANPNGNHQAVPVAIPNTEDFVQGIITKNIRRDLHTDIHIYVQQGADLLLGFNGN